MTQRIWLRLFATAAIVASPLMADVLKKSPELPEPEKPGIRGCGTYLVKDDAAIAENMAKILFCIEKQMDAFGENGKIPDKNFVEELKKGKVSKALEEDYSDAQGLAKYLDGLKDLTGKGNAKAQREAIRKKAEAKKNIKVAKNNLKSGPKKALESMIDAIENNSNSLIKASGIKQLPAKRAKYGNKDVTKEAKAPFGPVLIKESTAREQNIKNLGRMIVAVGKLIKKPNNIPDNPKFIRAAADSAKTFWATPEAYGKLNEEGFKLVQQLVRDISVLAGALKQYQDDLEGKTSEANALLNESKNAKEDAKATLKGKSVDEEDGKDYDISEEDMGISGLPEEDKDLKKKSSVDPDETSDEEE